MTTILILLLIISLLLAITSALWAAYSYSIDNEFGYASSTINAVVFVIIAIWVAVIIL